ncbi:MAG: hypothetical protein ACM3OC_08975 [Deltaproteobacteria bacterium]
MRRSLTYILSAVLAACWMSAGLCQEKSAGKPEEPIGEFVNWKTQVPKSNYYIIMGAISIFGNRWGSEIKDQKELENAAWDQVVLSFEAFRRGITVDQKEVEEELDKTLKAEKAAFDRAKDPKAYEAWVKEKTKEPPALFENQLRHMIQLEKLRKQVLDSFTATVTDQEAFQTFLDQYNTLELELVQFDDLAKAKAYYAKMRDYRSWDAAGKKDPKFCRKPGFVCLEFLINMWKIPREDCYKMIKMEVNSVYPPAPVWKGYGVFRIVKKREADEKEFPKLKDQYLKTVEMRKKYEQLGGWLKDLRQEAGVKVYPDAPEPAK